MRFLLAILILLSAPIYADGLKGEMEVYFSPDGGCSAAIVDACNGAKTEILVLAYTFTSADVAGALIAAHKRKVDVRVIVDQSDTQGKGSEYQPLVDAGIKVLVDSKHRIAHNKVIVIDGETVLTGSYNYTYTAEHKNAENLLVIKSKPLAEAYRKNWELHASHSK